MPKATMTATEDQTQGWPDGGVPDLNISLPANKPSCCPEHANIERGDIIDTGRVKWEVRGWADDGRLWVKAVGSGNTKWFTCTVTPPACTPEDSPVCTCGVSANGFGYDPATDFWVHSECGKPTSLWLQAYAARQGAVSW